VTDNGRPLTELNPERRVYTVTRTPLTETAIDRGFTRDLYVALGEPVSATAWGMRVYYKPMVGWIWGGCLLMALGGMLAVLDRRYRAARKTAAERTPPTAPGTGRRLPQPGLVASASGAAKAGFPGAPAG
jgi:cytochrome c-type biogenesis protein CcmF